MMMIPWLAVHPTGQANLGGKDSIHVGTVGQALLDTNDASDGLEWVSGTIVVCMYIHSSG